MCAVYRGRSWSSGAWGVTLSYTSARIGAGVSHSCPSSVSGPFSGGWVNAQDVADQYRTWNKLKKSCPERGGRPPGQPRHEPVA